MGVLDEIHYDLKLISEANLGGCAELDFEQEPETAAIEDAVKILLQGLGEDINRKGLIETPLRVAKAFREGTKGYTQKVKDVIQGALFPEPGVENGAGQAGGAGGLVRVRDLDHFSYCESCLLPFQVKCHIGYIPSVQRVVGLSKLSRVADMFAKRFQDPQRLADEICSALQHSITATGVAVILQCQHIHYPNFDPTCFDSNHQRWIKVLVKSGSGSFAKDDSATWVDFLGLLRYKDISYSRKSNKDFWCPSRSLSRGEPLKSEMVTAVASIIQSLSQDTCRKELTGTPSCYVNWLMNFKDSNLEMELNEFGGRLKAVEHINYNEHIRSEVNLPLCSICEHHLLPFYGLVHVGYISYDEVNPKGKSFLQSIVQFYGFKLQVQERLARQIAETVAPFLGGDVIIVVEANHMCMMSRGIEKLRSNTRTIAELGRFSNDPAARMKFYQSIPSYSL